MSSSFQTAREMGRLGALGLRAKAALRGLRPGAVLRRWAALEEGRFILLAPCLMAAGIVLWFAGGRMPAPIAAAAFSAALGAWLVGLRREWRALLLGARAAAFVLFGILLIAVRTDAVRAPAVPAGLAPTVVTGILEEVEIRERDRRYTVRVESIGGLGVEDLPRRVRTVWRGDPPTAEPGDLVRYRASLSPPPGPALPGGYDFSRQMMYEGIGGVGFSYEPPRRLEKGGTGFRARVERLRDRIANRIEDRIGGAAGAVAAALATGKRERIPETVVDDLRDAGLAHLLAISGLHMGLVAGFLFWSLRAVLVLNEGWAVRLPIKKIAAAGALCGAAVYLLLSGMAWSAQRAFIMAAIVFLAIIFDRRGVSLRNAALAAMVIMLIRPEAVVAPGFQMSFAAVLTLVAAFEQIERNRSRGGERTIIGRGASFVSGLTLTSLLAGFATAPFAVYHFGRLASYGLLGNLLAMPMVTLAVMPALVLSLFLMPFGLDGPVLLLVGQGVDMILATARFTADLPGSVQLFPPLSPWALVSAVTGVLLLTLLAAPWRLFGGAFLVLAVPLASPKPRPDIYVSRELRNVGLVLEEGEARIALLSMRRDRFTAEAWLTALAAPPDLGAQEAIGPCEDGLCRAGDDGVPVFVAESRAQLAAACVPGALVILRARALPGDEAKCAGRLVGLRADGTYPAASFIRTPGGWRGQFAE